MLKRFSFFVIVNVKTSEFQVFATAMKDWRLRYSAMKSSFKRWANQTEDTECEDKDILEHPYREYYKFFMSQREYAYILDKGTFTEDTANEHVNFLTQRMRDKSTHSLDVKPNPGET